MEVAGRVRNKEKEAEYRVWIARLESGEITYCETARLWYSLPW